ncbi:hypothetical protein P4O66_012445 [Electrophorus voltai]|uniref:Uncharacterized protein n=1 Tax=Electrophorus voltai TaxID=2609070 RepID=A0AAD8Z4P1_9TELE|nr:hypothetical protein P4O66_012445 [Electrophorus voltai]
MSSAYNKVENSLVVLDSGLPEAAGVSEANSRNDPVRAASGLPAPGGIPGNTQLADQTPVREEFQILQYKRPSQNQARNSQTQQNSTPTTSLELTKNPAETHPSALTRPSLKPRLDQI